MGLRWVVEVVGVVVGLGEEVVPVEELSPPQATITKVIESAARSVSMAVSGNLRIGRAPVVARGIGSPPYQAPAAPPFASLAPMSVETAATTRAPQPPPEKAARASSSPWLLAVCCVAQFMVILDLSIVNVALPHIQSSLGFSNPALQWVVDAYAITFAGFLILGGRAADHFGQRRTFVLALLLFGLASLFGGVAPSQGVLVGARALQGFAGALMAACSLAIITASFAPGPQLHRAIGIWAAMNGLGGAAGVLLGGVITEFLSWRWVLLINPPIAIAAALVAYAVVAERRGTRGEVPFDLAGALTLTVGQMVLVYGVVEAGLKGWSTFAALGPIILGVLMLVGFGVIEARVAKAPLVPFKELTQTLKNANTIVLLFSAALFPMWILSTLYLQQVLGLTPLDTGLIFLPMTITIGVVARSAGRLVSALGVRAVLGSGLIMMTAGMLLLTRIAPSGSGIVYVMIPGILVAAGIALSIVPSTIAATQGSKEGQTGLASGLVNTSRQVGGGLGLAVLITLATQRTSNLIGAGEQVDQALTHGFRLSYLIGAILCGLAALMTFLTMPRGQHTARAGRLMAAAVGGVLALFLGITAAFAGNTGPPLGQYSTDDTYSYVTAPSLHPPQIRIGAHAPVSELAPGYIFTTNFFDLNEPPIIGQSGPLILDRQLQPVWFQPVPERLVAANLSQQTFHGKPVLAWWQGKVTSTGSTESGEDVVVNQHYQPVARVRATGGWVLTLHEFLIDGDHAWVTANKNLPRDLSRYGGAYNGALIDSAVQEYDLKSGRLLLNWDALQHIPLSESIASLPTNGFPWDAYHVNSIQLVGPETFLVSMRNTWAAYLVNARNGAIEWTLGGRRSSYTFGSGAAFQWQHDVRLLNSSTVTMFDDHCCQLTGGGSQVEATAPSRGLVLKLDQGTRRATLLASYGAHQKVESAYMGDTQLLPNGNAFVGWGNQPYFSEYTRAGKLLFEGEFPGPDLSYRATVGQWIGLPLTEPAGAARHENGGTIVYASWNGATQVSAWRVLGAATAAEKMKVIVPSHPRSGFETSIVVPLNYAGFEVQALDSAGHVLGTSAAFG